MKNLKNIKDEEIYINLRKINQKSEQIKDLMGLSLAIGVILFMGAPVAFLLGAMALAKAFVVIAILQSFSFTGFMLAGFSLVNKEDKLKVELKLRDEVANKTKEYQTEKFKVIKQNKMQNKTVQHNTEKDNDLSNDI